MNKKLKNKVKKWIKQSIEMGKDLDSLHREAQKEEFSQQQRSLEYLRNDYRNFFSAVKRLYNLVK